MFTFLRGDYFLYIFEIERFIDTVMFDFLVFCIEHFIWDP
jgi:hypothetical protein